MTAFVPVMLGSFWNDGAPSTVTTFRLGIANGIASLVVVLMAPLLGAITDQAGTRKAFLVPFTTLGILATLALGMIGPGAWPLALAAFIFASVGFFAANSLYDAMLVDVARPASYDRVSALGFGLGYLGGALLFTLNVVMLLRPGLFGLDGEAAAIQASFVSVAIWWGLFSLPLLLWVKEGRSATPPPAHLVRAGFRQLLGTIRSLRGDRNLLLFLAAYWLYIDGVYTIIKMAVDYGLSQGLSAADVTGAILVTNFIGFPAAIAFGMLGDRLGTRTGIYIGLSVYIVATAAAVFMTTAAEFYALAVAIGLVQGGVQALSRSFFARLIPAGRSGEYFGFYNMLGKFSSIVGPVLAGTAALVTGSQRFGILSVILLFAGGFWLLTLVREPAEPATHAPAG